jgi:N-methylhydantoinase B
MNDPIATEVIGGILTAVSDEMAQVLRRTSYNMMIYEVGDYCCALLDPEGRLISQNGGGVSHFVSDLGVVIEDAVSRFGRDGFKPGDVFVMNHEAVAGQHLNNVAVYMPFFFEGELIGFPAVRAHWVDVGGRSTGTGGGAAAEDPWLEGLQLNQIRIHDGGEPCRDVLRMIADNIRYPDASMGDLRAQMTTCQLAIKRLTEIFQKYGKDAIFQAIEQNYRDTEARCRMVVEALPDGEYAYESFVDDAATATEGPVRIHVKVTIAGSDMTMDFSGCSPQRKSSINSRTKAAAYIAYKAITKPIEAVNQGSFNALKVIIPEGSFMMARFPAPMANWSNALPTVVDTIFAALSGAMPDVIPAAHRGGGGGTAFFGTHPVTGKGFIAQSIEGGGWGGRPFEDGPSASVTVRQGDVRNAPIEALEQRFPLIVEGRVLRQDSGGAGKFRGGLGVDITLRGLVPGRWNMLANGRDRFPPWGLRGGRPGGGSGHKVQLPGEADWASMNTSRHLLQAGARVRTSTESGGGWGSPYDRDPAMVLEDVRQEYVSADAAREQYGVVLVGDGSGALALDLAATRALRDRLRAEPSPHR